MQLAADDEIEHPDGEATMRSAVCGSEVTVQLALNADGSVGRLAIQAKACAVGQASAAILQKNAVGASAASIEETQNELAEFLQGGGELHCRWADLQHLAPAKDHSARHSAILLPYKALLAGFEDAAKNHAG